MYSYIVKCCNNVTVFPLNWNTRFDSGVAVTDKTQIANGFNKLFVEIGPKLASQIKSDDNDNDVLTTLCQPGKDPMFVVVY